MLHRTPLALAAVAAAVLFAGSARADLTESLKKGTPDIKSMSTLSFAGDGVLLVGDSAGAAIFAIDTADTKPAGTDAVKIEGLEGKLAQLLQTDAKQILIKDLVVNPASGNLYVGVHRGTGPEAMPVLVKIDRKGMLSDVSLKDVKFSKAKLTGLAKGGRGGEPITSLALIKDKVVVAAQSTEDFASTLRAIPFPFQDSDKGTAVEIYHGAHGKFETNSPVRSFTAYEIKGEPYLLAGYQCTPLVKIPLKDLKAGEKVKGTTVAELGNGNRPLDMVVYTKDGKDYILITNSVRGVMKVTTENIDSIKPIEERISATAGLAYETIKELKGVEQLAKLDKERAVILVKTSTGGYTLETIALP